MAIRTVVLCMGLSFPANSTLAQSGSLRDDVVYTVVEKQPEFPGGYSAFEEYMRKNLIYPAEAQKIGIKGRVFLSFIVHKDGQITDINVLKGLGSGCDEEAVRVIKAMPRWTPGSQDGRPLNVRYNWPILFGVPYPKLEKTAKNPQPAPQVEQLFGHSETPPEFPGGTKAFMRYLAENTRYPEAAKQAGITGRVFASFVIDTAGYVSQPQVLKGLGYGCDEEAIRIINGLPRWKPGMVAGRGVVAVKYNLPINFPPK
ncbi:MAG: energy transducer TonB [Spirosoma sp.]|nr:energy transducer TonB [Spirosoma sp.]